jgi:hypothetical protein
MPPLHPTQPKFECLPIYTVCVPDPIHQV